MDNIIKVVHILKEYGGKSSIKEISYGITKRDQKILNKIYEGKVNSDTEVKNLFFKESNSGNYRTFKSRLRKKLIDRLLYINFESIPDGQFKSNESLGRSLSIIKVLFQFGIIDWAETLIYQIAEQAEKNHLTGILLECKELLRRIIVSKQDQLELERVNDQILKLRVRKSKEDLARDTFYKYSLDQPEHLSDFSIVMLRADIDELSELYSLSPSLVIFKYLIRLKVLYYQNKKDYQNLLKLYHNLTLDEINTVGKLNYYHNQSLIYLKLRKFKDSRQFVDKAYNICPERCMEWLNLGEILFFIQMNTKDFRNAKLTLNKVFGVVTNRDEERVLKWQIYQKYIQFILNENTDISLNKNNHLLRDKTPIILKIQLNLITILNFIEKDEYDLLLDNYENLIKGIFKALDAPHFIRTNIFINFLNFIIDNGLNKSLIKNGWQEYLMDLKNTPQPIFEEEIEIIPYEVLVKHLMCIILDQDILDFHANGKEILT